MRATYLIRRAVRLISLLLPLTGAVAASVEANDKQFLEQAYGESRYITIATGNQQSIYRAPAAATIITAEDISSLGATT